MFIDARNRKAPAPWLILLYCLLSRWRLPVFGYKMMMFRSWFTEAHLSKDCYGKQNRSSNTSSCELEKAPVYAGRPFTTNSRLNSTVTQPNYHSREALIRISIIDANLALNRERIAKPNKTCIKPSSVKLGEHLFRGSQEQYSTPTPVQHTGWQDKWTKVWSPFFTGVSTVWKKNEKWKEKLFFYTSFLSQWDHRQDFRCDAPEWANSILSLIWSSRKTVPFFD